MAPRSSKPLFLYSPRHARADRVSRVRWVVLALVTLAVSSPWHQRPFLTWPDLPVTSSHHRQCAPVRTATRRLDNIGRAALQFQAGDVVEITDDFVEGWHDATVDHWDGDSKLKVHYRQEGYDYHCLAHTWRVPIKMSTPPEPPKQNAVADLPKLPKPTAAQLQPGQKLRARVARIAQSGLILDVGAAIPAFLHKDMLPTDLLEPESLGREVDVWVTGRGRTMIQCRMQDVKSLVALVGQNFPVEVLELDAQGFTLVQAEVPHGSFRGRLVQCTDVKVGSKLEARLIRADVFKGLVLFKPLAEPEDIAAFEGVSDEQWLPAIVEARHSHHITIRVWPPTDGSSARTGTVEIEDLSQDIFSNSTEVVEVGQAVSVRMTDGELLRFSMNDKVDFSAFDGAESEWINATITDIGPSGILLRVPPPGGGLPARGFLPKVLVDAKVGQQLPVRVIGKSVRAGALHLTAADFAYFADLPRDQWIEGTVRHVQTFGAYVAVTPPGGVPVQGLLHRSNLKGTVKDATQVFKTGETVRVRVTDVDVKEERITLTMLGPGPR